MTKKQKLIHSEVYDLTTDLLRLERYLKETKLYRGVCWVNESRDAIYDARNKILKIEKRLKNKSK